MSDKPAAFISWAESEGYDIANTYDTERSRWVFFSPMTADLYKSWLSSRRQALEEAAAIAERTYAKDAFNFVLGTEAASE